MLRPQGESLWRQIARSARFAVGQELIEVGSGTGEALCAWAAEYGVDGTGAEADPNRVVEAEQRARDEMVADRVRFQVARPEDLPFRDASFDVGLGGVALGELADPAPAVAELVRVIRTHGTVILLQWTWAARVSAGKQAVFHRLLGTPVRTLGEWQRLLSQAGAQPGEVETIWNVEVPVPSAGLRDRIGVVRNQRGVRGLRGLARAVRSEREAVRLLGRGNLLGIALIKGTKWPS